MKKKIVTLMMAIMAAATIAVPEGKITAQAKIPASYEEYMQTSDLLKFYTETDGRKILNEAIAIASKATGAPHEKVKYLHDELCRRVTYDKSSYDCGTSYGALVNGRAKCIGYAKAYELLCDLADIPCRRVDGIISSGGHCWNIVQLEDGQWYEVDCTFDDTYRADQISYDWFLLSTEQMNKDHKRDDTESMKNCPIANGGIYGTKTVDTSPKGNPSMQNGTTQLKDVPNPVSENAYILYRQNGAEYWVNEKKRSAHLGSIPKNASSFTVPDTINYNGTTLNVDTICTCINDKKLQKRLKSITIGENVTSIQSDAFANCTKLKKVKVCSKKITLIARDAFRNTGKTLTIKYPKEKKKYKKMFKKAGVSPRAKFKS